MASASHPLPKFPNDASPNPSPRTNPTPENDFPFNSPPGEAGISPTNELINKIPLGRTSAEEPDQLGALPVFTFPASTSPEAAAPPRAIHFAQGNENVVENGSPSQKTPSSTRFMNKLKTFAPKHARSFSWHQDSQTQDEEQNTADREDDADAEETTGPTPRKKKGTKRFKPVSSSSSNPTTPRTLRMPRFKRSSTDLTPSPSRPVRVPRSNTINEADRLAFSEDERRGPPSSRPSGFRRFTGTRTPKGDRTTSTSAQKWRQLKASLKVLSARKKASQRLDHAKSAELMAELFAVTPAAMMVFSMFQRDDHGKKRVPVLLEQLKLSVTDTIRDTIDPTDRHVTFKIELEYATAFPPMKWSIFRNWIDLANLHRRYKKPLQAVIHPLTERTRLPKFPGRAIPYLRSIRGLYDDEEDHDEPEPEPEPEHNPDEAGSRRPSLSRIRRTTSAFGSQGLMRLSSSLGLQSQSNRGKDNMYAESVRKKVELYLQKLITTVMFRPDSARLCRFFELSALGVRLAVEGSYHGKEGRLAIKSTKGIDYRKSFKPRPFVDRHRPKWFLVRHSYIACVDSPDSLIVYDVILVDPDFKIDVRYNFSKDHDKQQAIGPDPEEFPAPGKTQRGPVHQLTVQNSERKTKLLARTGRQLKQWEDSIKYMLTTTEWAKPHRFQSFAPVRRNVWAQFLVDGQDYFWNVSRAIDKARDVIYIHDWWLSPEVYMRRPAAISQDWRLDRLLKKKADQGVKIFVIVYRNVESAIPINSDWTKQALLELSPNIIIQRSPNQLKQNTFFWAHHEKILVIDHCVAFAGGIDLCFGRWDTPEHKLNDDKLTGFEPGDFHRNADTCQLWPGKDYSNPRVQDFYELTKPYDEMYDRTQVPRMPWHDVSMQMVGQPARDLSRHFVQRWNFLLRQRQSNRPRPMLIPPPDFLPSELEDLDLTGSCAIQILRSAADWSLGLRKHCEHSIMTAYVQSIHDSEHLVYIENQFFITSCEVNGTRIRNEIGDALVARIVKAFNNGEKWKAIIVIPLVPGFQNKVDDMDGTSVRIIMAGQYYSICRGESSIFERLKALGINPVDYIEFYSLRSWGHIGQTKTLVTEQLYIHAKIMIVDDRIAIIGSANINERSMLGDRDSEVAVIVEDRDMLDSRLAGRDFKVGRFAFELRIRLMSEHLGIDVTRPVTERLVQPSDQRPISAASSKSAKTSMRSHAASLRSSHRNLERTSKRGQDVSLGSTRIHGSQILSHLPAQQVDGVQDEASFLPPTDLPRRNTIELGLPELSLLPPLPDTDDIAIDGPPQFKTFSNQSMIAQHPQLGEMRFPVVTHEALQDPVCGTFFSDVWHLVAENNTRCFRMVFRCQPDSQVKTWTEYKEWDKFFENFKQEQHGSLTEKESSQAIMQDQSDTVQTAPAVKNPGPSAEAEKVVDSEKQAAQLEEITSNEKEKERSKSDSTSSSSATKRASLLPPTSPITARRRGNTVSSPDATEHSPDPIMLRKTEAEEVLRHVQGHLIVWPYEWLVSEMVEKGNWMRGVDRMSPLEIYD